MLLACVGVCIYIYTRVCVSLNQKRERGHILAETYREVTDRWITAEYRTMEMGIGQSLYVKHSPVWLLLFLHLLDPLWFISGSFELDNN
jgi:hypothetical protein